VSDPRGALAGAILTTDGRTLTLVPSGIAQNISLGGDQKQPIKLTLFGARVEGISKPNAQFNVTSALRFSGAQRIAVLAYGKTTHLTVQGDWPSPGFDGGFLPISRTLSRNGFTAEWSVPFIARRENRFRLWLFACGDCHGGPAFRERRMGVLQSVAANKGFGHLHFAVRTDLHPAATRGQCAARGRGCQFPDGCSCHVLHS